MEAIGAKLLELGVARYNAAQTNIIHAQSKGYRPLLLDPESVKSFEEIMASGNSGALAGHKFETISQDGTVDLTQEAINQRNALNEVRMGERLCKTASQLNMMAMTDGKY